MKKKTYKELKEELEDTKQKLNAAGTIMRFRGSQITQDYDTINELRILIREKDAQLADKTSQLCKLYQFKESLIKYINIQIGEIKCG